MSNHQYTVFFQNRLSSKRISLIKQKVALLNEETIFVECNNGFISAWHNSHAESGSSFFFSEEHIESADVVYAVYCAQVPSLSFAREKSSSPLLFSIDSSSLLSDEDLIHKFLVPWSKSSIIVIEGGDGVGKETQTACLKKRVQTISSESHIAFPNYGGFCGNVIRDILSERKGKVQELSPVSLSLLFTMNRLSKKEEIRWYQRQGRCILLDRYYTANLGYQGSKVPEEEKEKIFHFFEQVEVEWLGIPMPSIVLYLDLDASKALQAMLHDAKRAALDANELASLETKQRIRDAFIFCCTHFQNWYQILCTDPVTDTRFSVEVVQDMIWDKVRPVIRGE